MRRFGVRIPTRARSRAKASTKVEAFFYGQVGTPSLLEREGLVIKKANAVRWTLILQDETVGKAARSAAIPTRARSRAKASTKVEAFFCLSLPSAAIAVLGV